MATTTETSFNGTLDTEKLERVQELLQGIKEDARKAQAENDLFMLSVYNDLLAVASPIVVKAHARIEREAKAVLNKAEKAARKAENATRKAEREAAKAQTTP